MKVIAFYQYRSPEGTVAEGDAPIDQNIFYHGDFSKVFDEIREDFDGQEFFSEQRTEAQVDLQRSGEWQLDDQSAGQQVRVYEISSIKNRRIEL